MEPKNLLTLAVAGSRKTQGIIEACKDAPSTERILIVTYTRTNQQEIESRVASQVKDRSNIEVAGWFSFLINDFVRPFVPLLFAGERIHGFDFTSQPTFFRAEDYRRYFNSDGYARRVHLAQLAHRINAAGNDAPINRIGRMYDRIYIDEVQDLNGWDLEVLRLLMGAQSVIRMVGDVRQAILVTNQQERKNSQFKFMNIWRWFQMQETAGLLEIEHKHETWRCSSAIAAFADALFDESWGFEATVSKNNTSTPHDGIFLVREQDLPSYIERFRPLFLRDSMRSARDKPYAFLNIGLSKGLSSEHVLIWPTGAVKNYLTRATVLTASQAADLYVASTRAEQSVGFVIDEPGSSDLPTWSPGS